MTGLYIYGAGGHGAAVAELGALLGYSIVGFIDDNPALVGTKLLDWAIIGGGGCAPPGAGVVLAVGNNAARARLMAHAKASGWVLPMLIHPSAVVSPSAVIGQGTVVMPQAVVGTRARIGDGCILSAACSVSHDCVIGGTVHIGPGTRLAGGVTVGEGTLVGVGSCARPFVSIGTKCIVGAGSVLVSDVPDGVTVYGNPARIR